MSAEPARARTGSLLVIFLTVFIDLLGFGIVLPLLPIYGLHFTEQYGMTSAQTGWTLGALMASYSLMQFLFLPLWGRLSDRFGRRPILILGLSGSVAFYTLFGIATAMGSLVGLFLSRIGAGIAGATISTAQAYIADTTTRDQRARGMALIGAAFALGFTLGPLLGAAALFSADAARSPWPGLAAAGLSAVALGLCLTLLPESLARPRRGDARAGGSAPAGGAEPRPAAYRRWPGISDWQLVRSLPSVGLLLVTAFIAVFSFAKFESTLSLQIEAIAEGHGERQVLVERALERIHGWGLEDPEQVRLALVLIVFAYLGLTLALTQGLLVRRLATRLSESVMASSGAVLAAAAFVVLALAARQGNLALLLLAMPVQVAGFALVNPSLQSLISRRSPPEHQGAVLGLGQSAASLARILGPLLGVRLFAAAPAWPYWAAALLMLLALTLLRTASRSGRDYPHAER